MKTIEDLMKHPFFNYFKEISDIPRESGNEQQISDYLVSFAQQRNLEVIQDEYKNVIIKKQCSKGYENIPTVILQGHMDMVCVKESDCEHDFSKDPLKLKIVEDMIYADKTTLGADNGVALAYSLAILDSNDLKHPQIEVVMTTEEESTMNGAINVDESNLDGKIMINLDSDKHNKLLVSSTGGIVTMQELEVEWIDKKENYKLYEIRVDGLKGGHSGEEIHKERGNANKIIIRVLNEIKNKFDIDLSSIKGGTSSNAIPRESSALVYIKEDDYINIYNLIKEVESIIKDELVVSDENVAINIKQSNLENIDKVFSKTTLEKLINAITLIPNGVQSMSMSIDNLVESSNNLGVIKTFKESVFIECEIRSCVKSKRYEIEKIIEKISKILNTSYSTRDAYPEWNYNADSVIREVFKDTYKDLYNEEIKLEAVHAGLETGVFLEKIPCLDVVSYGPNEYELHNPNEHMSISSCLKVWDVLTQVLKSIKNYY